MGKAPSEPGKGSSASPGQVLRSHREKAGLSLGQLAALIDVAPSQVLRWERDEYLPSGAPLMRLAQVLELPVSDLYLLVGEPVPEDVTSLPAMLRREYDLPPEALREMQKSLERVAKKYQQRKEANNNLKGGKP